MFLSRRELSIWPKIKEIPIPGDEGKEEGRRKGKGGKGSEGIRSSDDDSQNVT